MKYFLIVAVALLISSPAQAWHPWKTTAAPVEQIEDKKPAPVVEVRPTRGTIKGESQASQIGKRVGQSVLVVVGSQVVLGIVRIGFGILGVPFI